MLDRTTPPPFVQQTSLELIQPEIQTLDNGSRIIFIQGGEQEVLKVEFVFSAGRWFEPAPGISHFTSTLLPKGTTHHTSFEITSAFDFYGIHLENSPGFDFSSLAFYGLTRHFPSVMELIAEIITGAIFPPHELQQAKDIYIQGLKINLEKTSFLASRHFRKVLFGETHPYGYDMEETDVERLDSDNLTRFRDQFFTDFRVFVSGRLTDDVKSKMCKTFGSIKFKPANPLAHSTAASTSKLKHVDKEGSVQASLRIGKPSIRRNHPDYAGMLLLNHVLGGFFGSRLMKNIREEKGLTYGIHSAVHALKHESYFVIGADVNRENKDMAIEEITKEIKRLREHPISTDELGVARNHFVGSLQSELNTPFAHADKIKLINLFELPSGYYQQLLHTISAVEPGQLMNLANTYLNDEDLFVVSVG